MANPTYEPKNTALLCVDFYNDFLSEGYGRAGCRDQSFRARRVIGPAVTIPIGINPYPCRTIAGSPATM
jgi:hypothetical protein